MLPTHSDVQGLLGSEEAVARSSWPKGRRLLLIAGVAGACACATAAAFGAFRAQQGLAPSWGLGDAIGLIGSPTKTVEQWLALERDGGTTIDGVRYDPKDCARAAIAVDDESPKAWVAYGRYGGGEIGGVTYDAKACYRKALALNDLHAEAWMYLGDTGGDEIAGVTYDAVACYTRAIALDGELAAAWLRLGRAGGNHFHNHLYTPAECFEKAVQFDPNLGEAWDELARLGGGSGQSAKGAAQKALASNPKLGWSWMVLAKAGGGEVHGITFTPSQAYLKALQVFSEEPVDAEGQSAAWTELGFHGGTHHGTSIYSPKECFAEALKQSTKNARAYYGLGLYIGDGTGATPVPDCMNNKECFAKATTLDPKLAPAWAAVGWSADAGETDAKKAAFEKALKADPRLPEAWDGMANVLKKPVAGPAPPPFDFDGKKWDRKACLIKSVIEDPNYWRGWQELAFLADETGEGITVGMDPQRSAVELAIKALSLAPKDVKTTPIPWCTLMGLMTGPVTVDGQEYQLAAVTAKCTEAATLPACERFQCWDLM